MCFDFFTLDLGVWFICLQDFNDWGLYQDWDSGASLLVKRTDRYLQAFDMVRVSLLSIHFYFSFALLGGVYSACTL